MAKRLNVHEAKAHLSAVLDRLERGDEEVVIICRRNQPIAELRALPRRLTKRRPFGLDPRLKVPKSFFDPLPPELLDAFEGRDD